MTVSTKLGFKFTRNETKRRLYSKIIFLTF